VVSQLVARYADSIGAPSVPGDEFGVGEFCDAEGSLNENVGNRRSAMSKHHLIGNPTWGSAYRVAMPASSTTSPASSARRRSNASPSRRMYSPRCFWGRPAPGPLIERLTSGRDCVRGVLR
jgi:hypothetical protein